MDADAEVTRSRLAALNCQVALNGIHELVFPALAAAVILYVI
jgi:hypothetical protein